VDSPKTALSLFAGIGGLDAGLKRALPGLETVAYVERDSYAATILLAQMGDAALDLAPIWVGDIQDFDPAPFLGVDLVHGGFPCQDLSVAGKRAGIDGERSGLWREFYRIIRTTRPRFVFIENVPGILSVRTILHRADITRHFAQVRAAARTARERWYAEASLARLHGRLLPLYGIPVLLYVGCQLEELGYRISAIPASASDVGAPHQRERVFVLAVDNAASSRRTSGQSKQGGAIRDQARRGESGGRCDAMANAEHRPRAGRRTMAHSDVGNANRREVGHQPERQQRGRLARAGAGLPPFPPGPGDTGSWEYILDRWPELAPAVAHAKNGQARDPDRGETARNTAAGDESKSEICGLAARIPGELDLCLPKEIDNESTIMGACCCQRPDQLRCLGNAVVPDCAAAAWRELWKRVTGPAAPHQK